MAICWRKTRWVIAGALGVCAAAAQSDPGLVAHGFLMVGGRQVPYEVQHLPPASYPQLPQPIADELSRRGCLIPQTYEAHRPENVIEGSFEQEGSSDWAVLCAAGGEVKLMVFFGSDPAHPITLGSAEETQRVQAYPGGEEMGFNWGIDPASPNVVHDLQRGIWPRPKRLDHDALADSLVDFDQKTTYHYYTQGHWTVIKMPH
ncbi:MAG: hypothetical protein ACLGSD_01015 [Acidobacteriota bacterium]